MLKAVDLIANREGFGNFLAEGSHKMARKIGHNSIAFAMQVKGQETSMHAAGRIKTNMAYGFRRSAGGADHCGSATDGAISTDKGMTAYHTLGWNAGFIPNEISARKVGLQGRFNEETTEDVLPK